MILQLQIWKLFPYKLWWIIGGTGRSSSLQYMHHSKKMFGTRFLHLFYIKQISFFNYNPIVYLFIIFSTIFVLFGSVGQLIKQCLGIGMFRFDLLQINGTFLTILYFPIIVDNQLFYLLDLVDTSSVFLQMKQILYSLFYCKQPTLYSKNFLPNFLFVGWKASLHFLTWK